MAEKVTQKSGFSIGDMISELKEATSLDSEARKSPSIEGVKVDGIFFLKKWVTKYSWSLIIAGILLWVLFSGTKKRSKPRKRSHHGVNQYGQRY